VRALAVKLALVVAAHAHHLGPVQTVTATSYSPCSSGDVMADGTHTRFGSVASNRHPLGTLLRMRRLVLGRRYFRVRDRIGYGTELDVWQRSCSGAVRFGRRRLAYQVVSR
jgi:3D (Asp-Asp-Asp) domain-containing protein